TARPGADAVEDDGYWSALSTPPPFAADQDVDRPAYRGADAADQAGPHDVFHVNPPAVRRDCLVRRGVQVIGNCAGDHERDREERFRPRPLSVFRVADRGAAGNALPVRGRDHGMAVEAAHCGSPETG